MKVAVNPKLDSQKPREKFRLFNMDCQQKILGCKAMTFLYLENFVLFSNSVVTYFQDLDPGHPDYVNELVHYIGYPK